MPLHAIAPGDLLGHCSSIICTVSW